MLTGADFTGDVRIADDTELKFGDSTNGDLRIFHTSSNNTSTIREQGSSAFLIQGQDLYLSDTSGDNYLYGQSGADVRLYFNGSPKLNTRDTGVNFTGDITLTGTVDGRDVATDGTKLDGLKGTLTHNYWDSLQWQQGASRVLTTTLTQYGDQQSVKHQNSTYKTYVDLSLDLTYNSAAGTNDAYGYLSVTAPPPTGETTVNMGTCTLVSSGVTYITAFTVVGDWTEYFSRYVGISKNSNGSNAMGFPYKWVYSPNANTTTVWVSGFGNPPSNGDTIYLHPFDWESVGTLINGEQLPLDNSSSSGVGNRRDFKLYLGRFYQRTNYRFQAKKIASSDVVTLETLRMTTTEYEA